MARYRIPSNRMPPFRHGGNGIVYTIFGVIIASAGGISLFFRTPVPIAAVGVLFGVGSILHAIEIRRCRGVALARAGESICTFAHSMDYRTLDTWIIRAVYDELCNDGVQFPLRPSDRLDKDLNLDADAIEDAIEFVAERAGRSLDDWESNPLAGAVCTVGDFVRFLQSQPRVQANDS